MIINMTGKSGKDHIIQNPEDFYQAIIEEHPQLKIYDSVIYQIYSPYIEYVFNLSEQYQLSPKHEERVIGEAFGNLERFILSFHNLFHSAYRMAEESPNE